MYKFNKTRTIDKNINELCEYYDLDDKIKKHIKTIAKFSYAKGFKAVQQTDKLQ